MIKLTGVRSNIKPSNIDDTSSPTTVYVRTNILRKTEIDPIADETISYYEYDEAQYEKQEWLDIAYRSMTKDTTQLQEEVLITQLALAEFIGSGGGK